MKKVLKSVSVVLLFFATAIIFVFGCNINPVAEATSMTDQLRKNVVIDSYVNKMAAEYDVTTSRKTTKQLNDFAGNVYTLVECEPTGYMIYADDAASPVEYSAFSPSPYAEYSEGLYYGGPSFFYVDDGSFYKHTITGEKIQKTAQAQLKTTSNDLYNATMKLKNQDDIDYIKSGKAKVSTLNSTVNFSSFTCVNNYQFFVNLDGGNYNTGYNMGYMEVNGSGVCCYVAATMLLGYYDTFKNGNIIPNDGLMSGSGINRHFINAALTQELINLPVVGVGLSTDAVGIYNVLNKYFAHHGLNTRAKSLVVPFFSSLTINKAIDAGHPVIVTGSMYDPERGGHSFHAVLLYGYKRNPSSASKDWGYIAHYGWPGFSYQTVNVDISSTFGSICHIFRV